MSRRVVASRVDVDVERGRHETRVECGAARVRAMDDESAARFRTVALNWARKRIGMMMTYDSATEEALRRALRDAFGADEGVRVGRRAKKRFDALREAMRRSSGGRAVIGNETNMGGILESGERTRGRLAASETRDAIVASAWDDDIEWARAAEQTEITTRGVESVGTFGEERRRRRETNRGASVRRTRRRGVRGDAKSDDHGRFEADILLNARQIGRRVSTEKRVRFRIRTGADDAIRSTCGVWRARGRVRGEGGSKRR